MPPRARRRPTSWAAANGLFARLDGQIRARSFGYDVAPVVIFDQRVAYQYLRGLAQQVDQPVIEASLQLNGANVSRAPGRPDDSSTWMPH